MQDEDVNDVSDTDVLGICVSGFAKEGVNDSVDVVVDVNVEVSNEAIILLDVNAEVILGDDDGLGGG